LKPSFHPLKQEYKKKAEGVYRSTMIESSRGVTLGQFMAKGYLPSLFKTGFGSLGPTNSNWKGLFLLFYEVAIGKGLAPKKPFPEYLVDKDATLFPKGENSW
jgi:jumonji domain-containing protein 2